MNLLFKVKGALSWSCKIEALFTGEKKDEYELALRMPGWADGVEIWLNGEKIEKETGRDGYLHFLRKWEDGDCLKLSFGMPVRVNRANPSVKENIGKAAVSRGPLVYCLEEADNGDELHRLFLCTEPELSAVPSDTFEGTISIIGKGKRLEKNDWADCLYASEIDEKYEDQTLTFIPYYLWNNRGEGEMRVWVEKPY